MNHPNLLAIFDVGSQDGSHYLVSELLEGKTLRERLSVGPLSLRKAVEYGVQMANGCRMNLSYILSIGGLTSLTIEISQVFLPTRDSSALDLINNVLGTLIGSSVMMAMHERWYRFLGRIEDRR